MDLIGFKKKKKRNSATKKDISGNFQKISDFYGKKRFFLTE
jgi:hypothetical protein